MVGGGNKCNRRSLLHVFNNLRHHARFTPNRRSRRPSRNDRLRFCGCHAAERQNLKIVIYSFDKTVGTMTDLQADPIILQ